MTKFREFIYFIIILFSTTYGFIVAAEEISIEAKEYNNKDAFIIHHSDFHIFDIKYSNNIITIKSKRPISYRIMTPVSINYLSDKIQKINSKTLTIQTKEKYDSFEVVKGENLTAIRFKTDKTHDKKLHKIQPLNKNNKSSSVGMRQEAKEESSKVIVKKTQDNINIIFEFDKVVPAASFIRGKKLWLVFDKKKTFSFPQNMPIKRPIQINSKDHSILKFDMPIKHTPEIYRMANIWNLVFTKNPVIEYKDIKIQRMFDNYGIIMSGPKFSKKIAFKDPDVGDMIEVFTTNDNSFKVSNKVFYSDFTVLDTILGAAISWISEDHESEVTDKKSVTINSKNNAFFNTDFKQIYSRDKDFIDKKSNLPNEYVITGFNNFLHKRSYLYTKIADSKTDLEKKTNLLELSKFFFSEGLYRESNAAISSIDFDVDFLNNNPEAPLLKAVNLSILGYFNDSNKILDGYKGSRVNFSIKLEAKIFERYNNFKLGRSIEKIGTIDYLDYFITYYHHDLYWELIFTDIEINDLNNDIDNIQDIMRKVDTPNDYRHNNSLNFYKANLYKKIGKYDLANNVFDKIIANDNDPRNKTRSTLEKIKMLLKAKQINNDEAVKALDELKFIWRGDSLELDVLDEKVFVLYNNKEYIKALRTYKYMLGSFPNNKASVQITNQMAEIYNNRIFSANGLINDMTDFESVALYYEFRDLTPIGSDGDKIVLYIANRMINLDLLDEAEKIISHQVKFRLDKREKIVTGDHLAAIYIKNKKPQLAVDILNDTDLVNFGYLEHISRQRIKAKAFLDLEMYDNALDTILNDESDAANTLREEAYFRLEHWEKYKIIAESSILSYLVSSKKIPKNREKEVLRLAIAYSMTNSEDVLNYLIDNIKTDNELLMAKLKLIQSTNEPVNVRLLETDLSADSVEENFNKLFKDLFQRDNNEFFN